jgi:lipopolysaccharide transport system ATP-binding protein
VAFSNLGDFIDVPVRNYSSGMYVRLGFSVAVHTDPEVLLVDEVLAVGDAAFQRKCIDRINQLRSQGVTILFVAHDANLVQRMCQRAIWMDKGSIRADGPAEDVLRQYMWYCATTDAGGTGRRWGTGEVIIDQVRLGQTDRQERDVFTTGQPFSVEIRYRTQQRVEQPVFGLAIHDSNGLHITGPNTQLAGHQIPWIEGEGVVHYTVPSLTLLEGTYYMSVAVCNREETCMYDFHDRLYAFRILSSEGERKGVMTLKGSWSWNGQKYQESLSGSKQRN